MFGISLLALILSGPNISQLYDTGGCILFCLIIFAVCELQGGGVVAELDCQGEINT